MAGCRLDPKHPPVSLIDTVAADTVIIDRLPQVGGRVFLPGFPVADLVAVGEAVPVSVNATGLAMPVQDLPGSSAS